MSIFMLSLNMPCGAMAMEAITVVINRAFVDLLSVKHEGALSAQQ